jgi:hypothetical protein
MLAVVFRIRISFDICYVKTLEAERSRALTSINTKAPQVCMQGFCASRQTIMEGLKQMPVQQNKRLKAWH